MHKNAAQALVGTRVSAWTAANGTYSGIFEEILIVPGKPWRAKVRIDGVLRVAQHLERGSTCRRGYRPGEMIEVGGSSISQTDKLGSDYRTALADSIAAHWARYNAHPDSRDAWVEKAFALAETTALSAEDHRLLTGEWNLRISTQTRNPIGLAA